MNNNQLPVFNLPINDVSFGQVSIAILREIYNRGLSVALFPIGNVSVASQKPDPKFNKWLESCILRGHLTHSRSTPCVKLWHLQGSLESPSKNQSLITFHELDGLTPLEINAARNQEKVWVTSHYTEEVFKSAGLTNVDYLPLGFDSYNFHQLEKRPTIDGVISFAMNGKLEHRKSHLQMIAAWAKKYGNNKKYRLNLSVSNMSMKGEDIGAAINHALGYKSYFNINPLPRDESNEGYNKTLQASNITLSCSRGEGYDLPTFQATALGAWPVVLNAHVYKDYLNNENAIMVEPNGMEVANDGVYFRPGTLTNCGNWYTFSDDAFIAGCEEAEKRAEKGINIKGLELQKMTYAATVDKLLG